MNRKLHNTVMALIASSSLFVLGLLTSTPPIPALTPAQATAMSAAFDAENAMAAETVDAEAEADLPRRHVRRGRGQSVAMPFFSFAPRG